MCATGYDHFNHNIHSFIMIDIKYFFFDRYRFNEVEKLIVNTFKYVTDWIIKQLAIY